MVNRGVADLLKETLGIAGILQRARESYTGQELKRNSGVLNEGCVDNVSMDLEQMGLMGNRFYGRNHQFFVCWRKKRDGCGLVWFVVWKRH